MAKQKVFPNGKGEALFQLFKQQVPESHMKAYELLLNLNYPINDRTTFCEQIEAAEASDITKQFVLNCFTPREFGIDSVQSALEKFQLCLTEWTASADVPGMGNPVTRTDSLRRTNPWVETEGHFSTGIPPVGVTPWNRSFRPRQIGQWNPPNRNVGMQNRNVNWEFGTDICGEAAACCCFELLCQGMNPNTAYQWAREREQLCRTWMPDFGADFHGRRASVIWANCFIVQGREVNQCTWAAQQYLTCCATATGAQSSRTTPSPQISPELVSTIQQKTALV